MQSCFISRLSCNLAILQSCNLALVVEFQDCSNLANLTILQSWKKNNKRKIKKINTTKQSTSDACALVCYPPTWFVTHPLGNKSHLVCYPLPSYHLTILPKSQVPTPPCHLNILPSHENEERDSYHLTILPSHETRKGPVPSYHLTIRRTGGRISRPGLRALSSDMLTVHISLRSVT